MTTTAVQSMDKLRAALAAKFPPSAVNEIIFFFNKLLRDARYGRGSDCITAAKNFVEANLKCLHYRRTGTEVDSIAVAEEISDLEQATSLSKPERTAIPHTLQRIDELCNDRGETRSALFDPIQYDCNLVVALSKWVIAEFTRLYLTNDAFAAQQLVENLRVKELSLIEDLDGDRLVLVPGLSARIQLEMILWKERPTRCSTQDLAHWIHNQSIHNIRVTLGKMRQNNLVHETKEGWILTEAGVKEAEGEISKLLANSDSEKTVRKSSTKGGKRVRK
jgi:hypothetical protein